MAPDVMSTCKAGALLEEMYNELENGNTKRVNGKETGTTHPPSTENILCAVPTEHQKKFQSWSSRGTLAHLCACVVCVLGID